MAHAAHDEPHAAAAHGRADETVHVPGDDLPHHGHALDEPRSPAWLPVLGVLLLASALVWWLSTPSDADEAAAAAAASASASAAAEASASANPSSMVSAAPMPTLTANNAPPRPSGLPGMPPLPSGMQLAPGAQVNPKFKKP